MKIKKGDNVIVIAGKEKGKKGVVSKSIPALNKIIIDGLNTVKKHQKAKKTGEKGQTIEVSMPLNVSNVKLAEKKEKVVKKAKVKASKK